MPRCAPDFVRAHTRVATPPLVPEISLYLSQTEPVGLWEQAEQETGATDLAPPFWAYPWAGGIALARYLLDNPELVRGLTVLDLASGSGLVAIAAALAGGTVTASDIDPMAVEVIGLNAAANGVTVTIAEGDLLGGTADAAVVLAGDACYERRMAHRILGFLDRSAKAGARVLIGDPGRAYGPEGFAAVASYAVPAWPGLEDAEVKQTTIWEPR